MTRKQFKEKLTEKFNALNIPRKTLLQFKRFMMINESMEGYLSSGQVRAKYKYRKKLKENQELAEQYYVWHLLTTLNTKWNLIRLEKVVTEYYSNSKIINEIWKGE